KLGNKAAHEVRQFRFSESLTAWEHIYVVVKWFVEVYGFYKIEVPPYVDPLMKSDTTYDLEEMKIRFNKLEKLLKKSISREQPKEGNQSVKTIIAVKSKPTEFHDESNIMMDEEPGFTTVRTISYNEET